MDFLSARPAWSTEGAPGQPEIHGEMQSPKTQKLKKKKKKKKKKGVLGSFLGFVYFLLYLEFYCFC